MPSTWDGDIPPGGIPDWIPRLPVAPFSFIWLTVLMTLEVIVATIPGKKSVMTPRITDSLDGIVVGSKGYNLFFNCVDESYNAVDVSVYNGNHKLYVRSPDGNKNTSMSITFSGGGTDGKLAGAIPEGMFDREGIWKGQVELNGPGAQFRSSVFAIPVSRALT